MIHPGHSCPELLKMTAESMEIVFTYRTITFCVSAFQLIQLTTPIFKTSLVNHCCLLQPQRAPRASQKLKVCKVCKVKFNSLYGLLTLWTFKLRAKHVGLGSSLFARHYLGNNYCSIFHLVLRCFTSQGSLLSIAREIVRFYRTGFIPIRKSPDQRLFGASP